MRRPHGFRDLVVILLIVAVVGTGLYLGATRIVSRIAGPKQAPSSLPPSGTGQPATAFEPWLDEAPAFSAPVHRGNALKFPADYADRWVWLLFASKG
ncbi:MAG: hypothetical protein ACM3XN_07725 [Chloroflexota bacterium]